MTNGFVDDLLGHLDTLPVLNTHSHHRPDDFFEQANLDLLLSNGYVAWCGEPFDNTRTGREQHLNQVRNKSYFVWLERSLQRLYGLEGRLRADNWDEVSKRIAAAYQTPGHNTTLLRQACRYERVVLDTFWSPGDNNGHPDLFAPSFRVNMFHFGYSPTAQDHNGNHPLAHCDRAIDDMDEYIAFVRTTIAAKKEQGCVALKQALAYDRGLDFLPADKAQAQRAFRPNPKPEDIKAFQDYVFWMICDIAAELDLPLQCHTGLGLLQRTNAMQMQPVIQAHPQTKFVLFHGSYPWTADVCALTHEYRNVYPDLCWLPLISPTSCERLLHELIEVGLADRVCWGCDTWTGEESFGALLAMREVLSTVLAEKVQRGYFAREDAFATAENILLHNANKLYFHR